jgi:hypothetical protein
VANGDEGYYNGGGNGGGADDVYYDPTEGQTGGDVGVEEMPTAFEMATNESVADYVVQGTAQRFDAYDRTPVPQVVAQRGSPDLSSLSEISRFVESLGRTTATVTRSLSDIAISGRRAIGAIQGPLPPPRTSSPIRGAGGFLTPITQTLASPPNLVLLGAGALAIYFLTRGRA